MKGSSPGCFEAQWAVGIITLVRKFFIAHDKTPGAMEETMWWDDVLKVAVVVVVEGCLMPPSGVELLAISLADQFGNSVRQICSCNNVCSCDNS
jgi:hypothetical protein